MYIIWKNKDSRSVNNLIIQSLPPITKAPMRVENIKIDGRDGDIIEELGYNSYEKVIKIGIKDSLNIDEILNYFNGSGDLVTSEEPNKIYKAKIINQIDYNRLLKFRETNIVFHVQPFKYLKNENNTIVYNNMFGNYTVGLSYTNDKTKYVANSEMYSFISQVTPNSTYTIKKKNIGNRFAIILSEEEPIKGNPITSVSVLSAGLKETTLTTGINDKYLVFLFYRDDGTQTMTLEEASEGVVLQEGSNIVEYKNTIVNQGTVEAKPLIHIKGKGNVNFILNGKTIFSYNFQKDNEVYIDSEEQEAYLGDTLKNQNMNGDFPILTTGENIVEKIGEINLIEILPRSRWL